MSRVRDITRRGLCEDQLNPADLRRAPITPLTSFGIGGKPEDSRWHRDPGLQRPPLNEIPGAKVSTFVPIAIAAEGGSAVTKRPETE